MSETPEDITKDALSSVAERVHDEANKAASIVTHVVEEAADAAQDGVEEPLKDRVDQTSRLVEPVRQGLSTGAHAVADTTNDITERAAAAVKGHPTRVVLVVAAIAAAGGFAAGVLSSRRS